MLSRLLMLGLGYLTGVCICLMLLINTDRDFSYKKFALSMLSIGIILFTSFCLLSLIEVWYGR